MAATDSGPNLQPSRPDLFLPNHFHHILVINSQLITIYPPKMNESHMRAPFKWKHSLPTSIFQGVFVSFRGRYPFLEFHQTGPHTDITPQENSTHSLPQKRSAKAASLLLAQSCSALAFLLFLDLRNFRNLQNQRRLQLVAMLSKCTFVTWLMETSAKSSFGQVDVGMVDSPFFQSWLTWFGLVMIMSNMYVF